MGFFIYFVRLFFRLSVRYVGRSSFLGLLGSFVLSFGLCICLFRLCVLYVFLYSEMPLFRGSCIVSLLMYVFRSFVLSVLLSLVVPLGSSLCLYFVM